MVHSCRTPVYCWSSRAVYAVSAPGWNGLQRQGSRLIYIRKHCAWAAHNMRMIVLPIPSRGEPSVTFAVHSDFVLGSGSLKSSCIQQWFVRLRPVLKFCRLLGVLSLSLLDTERRLQDNGLTTLPEGLFQNLTALVELLSGYTTRL